MEKYHNTKEFADTLNKPPFLRENQKKFIYTLFSVVDQETSSDSSLHFFEFGSRHYAFPSITPFSPQLSHWFIEQKDIPYHCFDPEVTEDLFIRGMDALEQLKNNEGVNFKDCAISYKEFHKLRLATIQVRNEEFFPDRKKFKEYVDYLPELKEKIDAASLSYSQMKECIESTSPSVVFSYNVLNYPQCKDILHAKGLDMNNNYWNIENALHIHGFHPEELLIKLGYPSYKAKKYLDSFFGDEEISAFKEFFDVDVEINQITGSQKTEGLYWHA